MAHLLYGFMNAAEAAELVPELDGGGLELVEEGDVAALVRLTEHDYVDPSRKNLLAYSSILEQAASAATVLPMRFGVIVPSAEEMKSRVMRPLHDRLVRMLQRFQGLVEVDVKGLYDEQRLYAGLLRENAQLLALKERIAALPEEAAYYDRIRLGELVARAISARREADQARAVEWLASSCVETITNDPVTDLMAVNLALLIDRNRMAEVEERVDLLAERWGADVGLRMVGPLPPFTFVDLQLPVEA